MPPPVIGASRTPGQQEPRTYASGTGAHVADLLLTPQATGQISQGLAQLGALPPIPATTPADTYCARPPSVAVPLDLSAPERMPRFVTPPSPSAIRLGYAQTLSTALARRPNEPTRDRLMQFLNGSDGPRAFLLAWGTLDVRAMDRVILQVGEVAERLSPDAAMSMAIQMHRMGIDDTENQNAAFQALVLRAIGSEDSPGRSAALEMLSAEGIVYDEDSHSVSIRPSFIDFLR